MSRFHDWELAGGLNPDDEDRPEEESSLRPCCFCQYLIEDNETVIVVTDDRVNGSQVAHVGCAVECPECRKVVKAPLVQVNPKTQMCGDCTRSLIEQATGGWAL